MPQAPPGDQEKKNQHFSLKCSRGCVHVYAQHASHSACEAERGAGGPRARVEEAVAGGAAHSAAGSSEWDA